MGGLLFRRTKVVIYIYIQVINLVNYHLIFQFVPSEAPFRLFFGIFSDKQTSCNWINRRLRRVRVILEQICIVLGKTNILGALCFAYALSGEHDPEPALTSVNYEYEFQIRKLTGTTANTSKSLGMDKLCLLLE